MSYCWLIFMPISILVQGVIYLGLSIWGLAMRACSSEITSIDSNPFGFVMDLIYFYDLSCGSPKVTVPGQSSPVILDDTNYTEPTINRTEAFLICYLVISVFWIVFSMFTISSLSCSASKTYKLCSFIWWFSSVIGGCILDAVATGFHIYDVVHTTSADNTFSYLGISTTAEVMSAIRCYDGYFVAPSLVMLAVSSRAFIFWLINILGVYYCAKQFKNFLKEDIAISSAVLVVEDQNKPAEMETR